MRAILTATLAAVFAVGVAGCAQTGGTATNEPCASCSSGYVGVKKTTEKHAFCVVNGRQVDCSKTPSECPECAKAKK